MLIDKAFFLMQVVCERNKLVTRPPILVKIAPDLTEDDKKDIAFVLGHPKVIILITLIR